MSELSQNQAKTTIESLEEFTETVGKIRELNRYDSMFDELVEEVKDGLDHWEPEDVDRLVGGDSPAQVLTDHWIEVREIAFSPSSGPGWEASERRWESSGVVAVTCTGGPAARVIVSKVLSLGIVQHADWGEGWQTYDEELSNEACQLIGEINVE